MKRQIYFIYSVIGQLVGASPKNWVIIYPKNQEEKKKKACDKWEEDEKGKNKAFSVYKGIPPTQ